MKKALEVNKVVRTFKKENGDKFNAVDGVSFDINEGQIYGLLGPNGAGKSTLINMISGVLLPTHGHIELFGIDIVKDALKAKKMLGVVPQEIVVEPAFTVREVLYYFSGMYGVPIHERNKRIEEVLEDLNLSEKIDQRARYLSGGMKRRLMIAKAILHKPKLLILDEPTAGVDVSLRQKIWDLVRRLNKEGTTILFTTHYLEEAEHLCESISVVNHGKIVKEGKLSTIQKEFSRNVIHFELFNPDAKHLDGVKKAGSNFEYPVKDLAHDLSAVTKHYGENLKSIKNENASLEQIFLELTEGK